MWGSLPYILKEDLHKLIQDLPDRTTPGRSGHQVHVPTAARVCRQQRFMSETKAQLKHLIPDMNKSTFNNVCSKYKNLPDTYYGGDYAQFIGPMTLTKHLQNRAPT
jgi:hypothetical protein